MRKTIKCKDEIKIKCYCLLIYITYVFSHAKYLGASSITIVLSFLVVGCNC